MIWSTRSGGGRKVLHFDRLDDGIFTDRYEVSLEITDRSAQRVDRWKETSRYSSPPNTGKTSISTTHSSL